MKIVDAAKRALGIATIEKRDGVFIGRFLEATNAKKWFDWATKWGVPNVVPASEMHVTQIVSTVDLKTPLIETGINIPTTSGGCFALFGPDENILVFTFRSWELYDRNWALQDMGAIPTCPTYRPHLNISSDIGDFELPDAALQEVPSYVVLGPEISGAPKPKDDPSDQTDDDDVGDSEVVLVLVACSQAAELLKSDGEKMPALAAYDLADVAHGKASKGVLKRLAEADWAPAEFKAALEQKKTEVRKKIEREMTIAVSNIPEEIAKALKSSDLVKANDDEQIVMGIASVSTVNGELVKDLHGDEVTTQALVEFNRSLISGSRAGKFMHEGEAVTEIVAGLVLSTDWQKALGIDLGYEPYLVEIHVPDATDWAEVKKGEWMLSVAGTMWYYEDEAADAEV